MVTVFPHTRAITALFSLVLFATAGLAQSPTPYVLDAESEVSIDGTSTRSDWTVYADDIEGNFGLVVTDDALQIEQAQFAVRATEVVSRRSTIMDRLIDEALKVEEHPVIRYDLTDAEPAADPLTFTTKGTLTLAGQTKDIAMEVQAERLADGKIRLVGSHPITMSEYGIEAPVAMFGALRTGDEVTVNFNLVVSPR